MALVRILFMSITLVLGLPLAACDSEETASLPSQPKGDRLLSLDVTMNENQAASTDYDAAFQYHRTLGADDCGVFQDWNDVEDPGSGTTVSGSFNDNALDAVNTYYPAYGVAVTLTLSPISTNNKVFPSDLDALAIDHPTVITRFEKLIDHVFSRFTNPDLELTALVIGSEMDIHINEPANNTSWSRWTTFFQHMVDHVHDNHDPDLLVTCEFTHAGLEETPVFDVEAVFAGVDVVGVSYYPLNSDFTVEQPTVVYADLAWCLNTFSAKNFHFYQFGYPTSATCDSSEARQAEFVRHAFTAWDMYAGRIKLVDFTWLHDRSQSEIDDFETFYGVSDPAFSAYLGSLGVRTYPGDGADKAGWDVLLEEAWSRGWRNPDV